MREIKFRAWDSKEKRMWRVLRYTFEGHPTITVQFNPTIKKWCEEYEIMQFTGLTDKNGKEIYEGDIVKATHREYEDETVIQEIKYEDGGYFLSDFGYWDYYPSIAEEELEIEVLGNIWEHPELINPKGGKGI